MFALSSDILQPAKLREQLLNPHCGAYVSFEGWVRNHNEGACVSHLEYSTYEAMAVRQGKAIIQNAIQEFDIEAAACVHRVGLLEIGDIAVWVGVCSAHRKAAFTACEAIIDRIKDDVPIWKKEAYIDQGEEKWLG